MASLANLLFRHYLHYLQQPAVTVTAFIIFGGFFLLWFENYKLNNHSKATPEQIPGCYRLGLYGRSNLDSRAERHVKNTSIGGPLVTGDATVKALFTYPLKSCRGVELKASEVLATGLKCDRLFSFAERRRKHGETERETAQSSGEGDSEWRFVTQREYPKLALLSTELWLPAPQKSKVPLEKGKSSSVQHGHSSKSLTQRGSSKRTHTKDNSQDSRDSWALNGGCLIVRFPNESGRNVVGLRSLETVTLRIPLNPTSARAESKQYTLEPMAIWKDRPMATNITNEIDNASLKKLQRFLGVRGPIALFRTNTRYLREVTRSLPQDRPEEKVYINFADAFPVNLLNIASIQAVDAMLPDHSPLKGSLDPRRFRANIYISGPPAYAEETWRRLNIGRCIQPRERARRDRSPSPNSNEYVETDGEYYVACRTARCKLVNVDPASGERDTHEPDETLRKNRDVDKGASPHSVLGMQMIPFFPQGVLRVGDEVEVLERGEHRYEKMFK